MLLAFGVWIPAIPMNASKEFISCWIWLFFLCVRRLTSWRLLLMSPHSCPICWSINSGLMNFPWFKASATAVGLWGTLWLTMFVVFLSEIRNALKFVAGVWIQKLRKLIIRFLTYNASRIFDLYKRLFALVASNIIGFFILCEIVLGKFSEHLIRYSINIIIRKDLINLNFKWSNKIHKFYLTKDYFWVIRTKFDRFVDIINYLAILMHIKALFNPFWILLDTEHHEDILKFHTIHKNYLKCGNWTRQIVGIKI